MKYQLLPPLSDEERAALERSIVEHGVLVPVEYDEHGEILDGHHRVAICESLGLVDWPRFVRKGLSETEKRALSRELNFARRHLTTAQKRALIADQLRDTPTISSRAIAAMLGVSDKTVAKVRQELVATAEIPQLEETVGADGKARPVTRKTIRTAFLPEPENRRELMGVAREIRARQQSERHAVRLTHMAMVAEKGQVSAPGKVERLYPVILADPPWRFGVRSEETGREKSPENHYPTMATEEITGLLAQLGGVAAKDAVLFLWATNPMLLDALGTMQAWGFTYKSHWIWDKEVAGTGYWGRDRHELLLIGMRGDAAAPLPGSQPETVHRERKGRHSAKPDFYAKTIERLYPGIPRIELFARSARPGWDVWGFEAGGADAPAEAPVELSQAEKAGDLPEAAGPRQRKTGATNSASPATSSRPDEGAEAAPPPAASAMAGAEPPPSVPAETDPASPAAALPPDEGAEAVSRYIASASLPPAPGVSAPVEFSVGGMKKGSFARFTIHKTPEGRFAIAAAYELKGFCGGTSPATGSIPTYEAALSAALDEMERQLEPVLVDLSSVCQDHHRAAARAGLKWCAARREEWGLS